MSEEERVTSRTGGAKGKKRQRFDLIPSGPLWELAELYGFGAEKYPDDGTAPNFTLGYDWSLSYAALQRHANQFWSGEDYDEESGLSHLSAVVFHAFALRYFMDHHPEFDDRHYKDEPKPEPDFKVDDIVEVDGVQCKVTKVLPEGGVEVSVIQSKHLSFHDGEEELEPALRLQMP